MWRYRDLRSLSRALLAVFLKFVNFISNLVLLTFRAFAPLYVSTPILTCVPTSFSIQFIYITFGAVLVFQPSFPLSHSHFVPTRSKYQSLALILPAIMLQGVGLCQVLVPALRAWASPVLNFHHARPLCSVSARHFPTGSCNVAFACINIPPAGSAARYFLCLGPLHVAASLFSVCFVCSLFGRKRKRRLRPWMSFVITSAYEHYLFQLFPSTP